MQNLECFTISLNILLSEKLDLVIQIYAPSDGTKFQESSEWINIMHEVNEKDIHKVGPFPLNDQSPTAKANAKCLLMMSFPKRTSLIPVACKYFLDRDQQA